MTKLTAQQSDGVNDLIKAALKPILLRLTSLESTNATLLDENKHLNSEISKLAALIEENKKAALKNVEIPQAKPLISSFFKTDVIDHKQTKPMLNDDELNLINAISIDNKDKIIKEKNLLVFGLEKHETKVDRVLVNELFESIGADTNKVNRVVRFKSHENKKPIVRVEFHNTADKFPILKNAKKLNGSIYKGVFINQDLTQYTKFLIFFYIYKQNYSKLKIENLKLIKNFISP